jgi:hypothetical protein
MMPDPERLKLAHQLREYHHKALWEEQKHFTWLLSIVLGAQVLVLTKDSIGLPSRNFILAILAGVAVVVVVLALAVVRREGAYFSEASQRLVPLLNQAFPDVQVPKVAAKANTSLFKMAWLLFRPHKLSIRDAFQLVLVSFAAGSVGVFLAGVFKV